MRTRSVVLLLVALGCGLIASVGITQAISRRGASSGSGTVETTEIFIALEDIAMGDPITPQVLKLEEWPKDKVPNGAFSKLEDLEGRRPKTKIYAGSPILESYLLGKGESVVDPTEHIPPGFRVVSVKVDEVIGAGRLIRPGDRVDLLVFMQKNPAKGIMETGTRTILQDLKVFAVGSQFDLAETEGEESLVARTVSLLVTPEQAEIVMLATELGSIRLVLRSPDDKDVVNLTGSFPHELGKFFEQPERDTEEAAPPQRTAATSNQMNDFLTFLKSQSQTVTAGADVEETPEETSWSVRVIQGPEVSEVVLAVPVTPAGKPRKQGGFSLWKLISEPSGSALLGGGGNTAEDSAATAEAEPEEEEPAFEEEPDDGADEPPQTDQASQDTASR